MEGIYIYENILSIDREISVKEIRKKIKEKYPEYCNSSVRCIHIEKGKIVEHDTSEWEHEVRGCLDVLKKVGKAKSTRRGYLVRRT